MGARTLPATMPERLGFEKTDLDALQESFRIFNRVTRDLERAYGRLQDRATAVEGRLRDANGRLTSRIGSLERVTDELHGILDAIPSGVVTCTPASVLARVNPAAERILGRPAAELVGRDARTLLSTDGEPLLLLGCRELEEGVTRERRVSCLDGSTRYLAGSVAALPDGGRLEVISDQTEVAHLRNQVTRLDTLAALGEMAAGVAHEIRNPMSAVEGFAGLLERSCRGEGAPARDQLLRYADRIRKGVAEVNGIITNLLMWARPERALMDRVELASLFAELIRDLESEPAGAYARVEVAAATHPWAVRGDRLKLKLALGNLVRNAREAAGSDGHVRLAATCESGRLTVTVDDDGPGLDPRVRCRLFRPFTTTKASGTGLGLAIARKLVDLHGGEIVAGDGPLGGARFAVLLPLAAMESVA